MMSTADLVDRYEGFVACCELQFRSFGRRNHFAGEITTIDCVEDNVLVRETLTDRGDGKVLVVDGHGSLLCALVGDVIAGMAAANGWEGLVIHGAVRDVAALAGLDIGVLALGANPCKSGKSRSGTVGADVQFGGVTFRPGMWLVADEDGVLVAANRLPPESAAEPR